MKKEIERLVIEKKCLQDEASVVVRVPLEAYSKIAEISSMTGRSKSEILSKLVLFVAENTIIK